MSSSVHSMRELINERLTAAAEDIFRAFERTVIEYEEKIDRQRRLLDIVWKPAMMLNRTELPQEDISTEEVLADPQQLCKQETNSSLDQENPEGPQIKEEQEELCTSLEVDQLVLKQETETFMWTPTCEESETRIPDAHGAESQDKTGSKHGDSEHTENAEPRPKKRPNKSNSCTNKEYDSTPTPQIYNNRNTCDICGKSFKYKSKLNRHQKIHTGEKPYVCNTCEKRFSSTSALNAHLSIHTGERPYSCEICGRDFRCNDGLMGHMRTHTGDKPYVCNTCGKRFSHSSNFTKHKRIHTGEKPYFCATCGKRFSKMSGLRKHMAIHTGEKPYPCSTCGERFPSTSALNAHAAVHAEERPYSCKYVGDISEAMMAYWST